MGNGQVKERDRETPPGQVLEEYTQFQKYWCYSDYCDALHTAVMVTGNSKHLANSISLELDIIQTTEVDPIPSPASVDLNLLGNDIPLTGPMDL